MREGREKDWSDGRKEGCERRIGKGLDRRKKRGMLEKDGIRFAENEEKDGCERGMERDWREGRKMVCERRTGKGLERRRKRRM